MVRNVHFMTSVLLLLLLALTTGTLAALDGSRFLWYDEPATDWESGALPIGCGRLGASIFGGGDETITISEDTIWSGPIQNRIPENGLEALPDVRELLLTGNITKGAQLTLREMTPAEPSERAFSYFGNLDLVFGHSPGFENYSRWLDTRQGNSGVSYTYNDVDFNREYIASYPAGVFATRFTASGEGALNLNASITRLESILSNEASVADGIAAVTMKGSSGQDIKDDPILFTGQARFVAPGAEISTSDETLIIAGATRIDLFFDVETNYRYNDQDGPEAEVDRKLSAATEKGFPQVKDEALADAGALLGRALLDLGQSPDNLADLPTDQRIATAREHLRDVELATLAWNYGRHLLVAASRNSNATIDMPANLQGVWNNETTAAWGGKYTININTEMNYWPAGPTNLLETQEPLFDLLAVAQPRGQEMARLYGCGGTVFHHNLDLWGDPAPTDNNTSSSMWPMGAAWLVQHMMEHYRYNGDKNFLRETVYPYLLDVAAFYTCYAFEWSGSMVTGPSISPENTFIVPDNMSMSVAGSAEAMDIAVEMDNQLMRDVFTDLIEAAGVLGIEEATDKDVADAKAFLPLIRPPRIGSQGQILEWRYEYEEEAKGHRHLSPLYGLHPSRQFSPLTNETLSQAARVLLDSRVAGGSGSTGWSRAWLVNQYARLHSGSDAWGHIQKWFASYPTSNLWNTDNGSGFQIDGNYGITSGITEMLLQSHAGSGSSSSNSSGGSVVHILPAPLPADASPTGRARGLLAQGGFEVDVEWEEGEFKAATVTSMRGGELNLRVQGGTGVLVNGTRYDGLIQTEKGQKYIILPGT